MGQDSAESGRTQCQLRLALKNNGLPPQGDIFDRAYAYIAEHS